MGKCKGAVEGAAEPFSCFLLKENGSGLSRAFLFPESNIVFVDLIMTQFAADYYAHYCAIIAFVYYKMHESSAAAT